MGCVLVSGPRPDAPCASCLQPEASIIHGRCFRPEPCPCGGDKHHVFVAAPSDPNGTAPDRKGCKYEHFVRADLLAPSNPCPFHPVDADDPNASEVGGHLSKMYQGIMRSTPPATAQPVEAEERHSCGGCDDSPNFVPPAPATADHAGCFKMPDPITVPRSAVFPDAPKTERRWTLHVEDGRICHHPQDYLGSCGLGNGTPIEVHAVSDCAEQIAALQTRLREAERLLRDQLESDPMKRSSGDVHVRAFLAASGEGK